MRSSIQALLYRALFRWLGDGSNDLSMIRIAGTGVAMENGVQGVLDAADRIAPDNDADGVGCVIETIL